MARIETILLVDDSRVTRMFVERILRPHCERVLMASGAEEGIEVIADEGRVSLVISDVYMAAGDGFRLLRDLQQLEDPPGALLMTGRDISEEDRKRADELGAIGFLKKPIRVRDILSAWEAHAKFEPTRLRPRLHLNAMTVIRLEDDAHEALVESPTHDISPDGIFVETEGPIPVGTRVSAEIRLCDGPPLVLHGAVIRVQEPEWMRRGGVAIQFDPQEQPARDELARRLKTISSHTG